MRHTITIAVTLLVLAALIVSSAFAVTADDAEARDEDKPKLRYALMETNKGRILLELNAEEAPISVENFVTYVEDEFYDGTIFHRVVPHFVIQGGGFTAEMEQKETRDPIKNEWENNLKNERGTIAMARQSQPDTATSQFFINVRNNAMLDRATPQTGNAGYAVFGRVKAGMDTVERIREVPTTNRAGHANVPTDPVVIERIRMVDSEDAERLAKSIESGEEEDENEG